jgi:hypothetical protein
MKSWPKPNWRRLEKTICSHTKQQIDRRRLKDIAQGKDVRLSLRELAALDAFLDRHGHGLFQHERLLEEFARLGHLRFYVGAYPRQSKREGRTDISFWDLRTVSGLLDSINRLRQGTHTELMAVLPNQPSVMPGPEAGIAVVVVGSPRSCYSAAEPMLRQMFLRVTDDTSVLPPFGFLWSEGPPVDSRFRVTESVVKDYESAASGGQRQRSRITMAAKLTAGVCIHGKRVVYREYLDGSQQRITYGVIAAQRLLNGTMLLVLAGLTGPGTYACARALEILPGIRSATLATRQIQDRNLRAEPAPVLWAIVQVPVYEPDGVLGDNRELRDSEITIVHGPMRWPD